MSLEIELPNGVILDAPDDADPSVVAKNYLAKNGQLERRGDPTQGMSTTERLAAGAGKAVTDIGRGVKQMLDVPAQYLENKLSGTAIGEVGKTLGMPTASESATQTEQDIVESRQLDAPLMETTAGKVGNVAGTVAAAVPAAFVPGANTLVGATLTGAALGAAQPIVEGESRTANTALGAVSGTVGYGVGKGVGAGINAAKTKVAQVAARKAASPATVPELDELKTLANAAYTKAENAGVVVSKNSFKKAVYSIKNETAYEGLDKTLHPKATAALKRLSEASGKELSFKELEVMRRVVKGAASSIEPDERRIARIMVDKLDDYMTNIKPGDVVSRDPKAAKEATEALTSARDLWTRYRKGDVVEDLIERAKNRAGQFTGSGYENALRTEFRNLAQNKKRMRGFTEAEKKSIRLVARGGTLENITRFLGKFAPTGTISALLGGGAGYAIGGPVGSAALLGAGAASRKTAEALTRRNVKSASELMRSGGNLPVTENPLVSLAVSKLPNLKRTPQALGILAPSISTSNR